MKPLHGSERDARPTVICLHASGSTGGQWKALVESLGHELRVLTPDLHGHGLGPAWDGDPADLVAADAARIGRLAADAGGAVHLVGHSYGGAVALHIAARQPRQVASLAVYEPVAMRVLFDYHPRNRVAAEVAEVASEIRRALNGGRIDLAGHRFVDYWSGAGQWARLAADRQAAIAKRMPVIHAQFRSLRSSTVRLSDYGRIDVPVLYLSGVDTRMSTRRIAELLEFALPLAAFERIGGMGHLGPITHAQPVAHRIARFIREQATQRVEVRKAA